MTKNDLKIKYIIGSYIDNPEYPTKEDLFAIADQWYHLEGGDRFIHEYRGLSKESDTMFTNNLIKEKGLPKQALDLLSELIEKGDVEVVKETKHTIYHKISKR
jgi:hypothetical protein